MITEHKMGSPQHHSTFHTCTSDADFE